MTLLKLLLAGCIHGVQAPLLGLAAGIRPQASLSPHLSRVVICVPQNSCSDANDSCIDRQLVKQGVGTARRQNPMWDGTVWVEQGWGKVGWGSWGKGRKEGGGQSGGNRTSDLCPRTFSTSSSISAVESMRATAMLALSFFLASSGSESSSESNSSA